MPSLFPGESYPIAPTPSERTCLMVGSLGVACDTCELVARGECDVRKAGAEIENLSRLNAEKSYDDLIPGFLTMKGMRDLIGANSELSQSLADRTVGAELIDVRGVHAGNETWGRSAGDRLLLDSAERLIIRRSRVQPHPARRRSESSSLLDVGFRGVSSDELGVLRTNLNLGDLKALVGKTSDVFSPENGIHESAEGKIPLVASVSYAHASELDLPSSATPVDVFNGLAKLLFDRHEPLKVAQYNALWRRVTDVYKAGGYRPPRKPKDPRLIIEEYWKVCCPAFSNQAQSLFRR